MADNRSTNTYREPADHGKTQNGRLRLRPVWMIIIAMLVLVMIVTGIKVCSSKKDQDIGGATVNIVDMDANVQTVEDTRAAVKTTVKIDLQSCTVVVGERIYVTATVTPLNTDRSVIWKSSDEKIFTVSSDGIINVVSVGTAALTATVGDISDAIVIEGIEREDSRSQLDLPSYDEIKDNRGEDANGAAGQNPDGNSGSGGNTSVHPGAPDGEQSGSNQGQGSDQQQPGISDQPDQPNEPGRPDDPGVQEPAPGDGEGLKSTQLPEVLGECGYHATGENVFVYGYGDMYAGEIIIQPGHVIIYIKNRTDEYSSAVREVLSKLLPNEYMQAWNNYAAATTDRTFVLEGRVVRVVPAGGGGHSQIVVYN